MDAEDRQVYNQIVESLNYLILQNPTNEYLPTIVNNITKRIVDVILRKEYRFLPLGDVVAGVMFEGIVAPFSSSVLPPLSVAPSSSLSQEVIINILLAKAKVINLQLKFKVLIIKII